VDDIHIQSGSSAIPVGGAEADRATTEHFEKYGDYNPADHHDALFIDKMWPEDASLQLTPAQDYVAMMGQGAIVDRTQERLGQSDLGVALLRRIFWREMEALREGRATKQWRRIEHGDEVPLQSDRDPLVGASAYLK
jgi:5,5'-dehydrodivanillate O-demethylase